MLRPRASMPKGAALEISVRFRVCCGWLFGNNWLATLIDPLATSPGVTKGHSRFPHAQIVFVFPFNRYGFLGRSGMKESVMGLIPAIRVHTECSWVARCPIGPPSFLLLGYSSLHLPRYPRCLFWQRVVHKVMPVNFILGMVDLRSCHCFPPFPTHNMNSSWRGMVVGAAHWYEVGRINILGATKCQQGCQRPRRQRGRTSHAVEMVAVHMRESETWPTLVRP